MNSDEIFVMLDVIGQTTSRKEKESLLRELLEDDEFKTVIRMAYDPFVNFGVLRVDAVGEGDQMFDAAVGYILQDLAKRNLTGNTARDVLETMIRNMTEESGELLKRILKKDLGIGINASTINKAMPGLIPTFGYMRCSLPKDVNLEAWDWKNGIYSQIKADGMFVNINRSGEKLSFTTREGQPFNLPKVEFFVSTKLPSGFQYHGEVVIFEDGKKLPRKTSNGLMNRVLKGGNLLPHQTPVFYLWDMVNFTEPEPYVTRFSRLAAVLRVDEGPVRVIQTRICYSLEEAIKHYNEAREFGEEGTIVKSARGVWKSHTSKEQVKMKAALTADLEVVEFLPGTGRNEDTFGSLLCKDSTGMLTVAVSGFTDLERSELWKDKDEVIGSIVEVTYNEVISDKDNKSYSLFLPRFNELRKDKTEADSIYRIL